MKSINYVILILFFVSVSLSKETKDIFTTKEIVWFGLDFSKAKMIGTDDFCSGDEIKNVYFDSWNDVLIKEKKKYNVSDILFIKNVIYDFSVVRERNKLANAKEIVTDLKYNLSNSDIQDIVEQYESKDIKTGIGLVIIIETFDKPSNLGKMFVTFFDIETKKILLLKKMTGIPGGFGLKNYWIRTVYNVFKEIRDFKFDNWKSECLQKN